MRIIELPKTVLVVGFYKVINFDFVNLCFKYFNVAVVDFKNHEILKCLHKYGK